MSQPLSQLLKASVFAADRHRDQRRKDAESSPYINHPLAVAELLATEGQVEDLDVLIAAILHDTIEDTQTTAEDIVDSFGPSIYQIVAEVTDNKELPKAERKRLQIESAPGKSNGAKQLKIADKICNIRDVNATSPASWDVDRKQEYLNWAQKVVAGCKGVNPHLDQLFDREWQAARQRVTRL